MLTIFRSPIPGILQAVGSLPGEVARLLERMAERPERFAWIVPTGRRKRALVHDWLAISKMQSESRPFRSGLLPRLAATRGSHQAEPRDGVSNRARVFPRFLTLESFVAEALQYSPRQKPRISGPERLLRLAGAWQELSGRSAGPGVIHQLDRYIRDCQACGVRPSPTSKDKIDQLVNRYLSELNG